MFCCEWDDASITLLPDDPPRNRLFMAQCHWTTPLRNVSSGMNGVVRKDYPYVPCQGKWTPGGKSHQHIMMTMVQKLNIHVFLVNRGLFTSRFNGTLLVYVGIPPERCSGVYCGVAMGLYRPNVVKRRFCCVICCICGTQKHSRLLWSVGPGGCAAVYIGVPF